MRVSDIINYAKEYLFLGIVAATILAVFFIVGYFVIYKQLMKGTKKLSKKTILLSLIGICYIVVVLGAVFLNRGSHYQSYNFHPFYGYLEAWNQWSTSGWRNIILNILLFSPLGFLLPVWSRRLQKLWRTVLCGFVFSLLIELVQLITLLGIFEVDDLINNTFGVLIGYGYGMLFLNFFYKRKIPTVKLIGYIIPTLIMIIAFSSIFATYSIKELGNLSSIPSFKVNMKNISLSSEINLSNEVVSASIYKAYIGSEQDAMELAKEFFAIIGSTIDETKNNFYDESALYYADGRDISIWVKYKGMRYSYTDFSQLDNGVENVFDANETTIREALTSFNIYPPIGTSFEVTESGSYKFNANMVQSGDKILDGSLSCEYFNDGTIKKIDNNIITYSTYRTANIKSELEAYEQIVAGKFISNYRPDKLSSITIKDVKLSYELDSKGYYQPVYRFECIFADSVNEYESFIQIPALK